MFKTLGFVYLDCNQEKDELKCEMKKNDIEKGLLMNYYPTDIFHQKKHIEHRYAVR